MKSTGIQITGSYVWHVSGKYETDKVIHALSCILPDNAILYFEGNSISKEVIQFYNAYSVSSDVEIWKGTNWPKPEMFHLKFVKTITDQLSLLAQRHAQPELFDHFVAYVDNAVLISGYDFGNDPLNISEVVPEKLIQEFSGKINCTYLKKIF